jgi:hypothetical protein
MEDEIHVINFIHSLTEEQKNVLLLKLLDIARETYYIDWYYDENEDPKFYIYWDDNSGEDLVKG